MQTRNFLASLKRNFNNVAGWTTPRKLVVFESDDWGSVRMPSHSVFKAFQNKGMNLATAQYNRLDALESNEDISALFEVLQKHRDKNDNLACFTANMIMANPDFKRIKQDAFENYYYEPFQETLKRYPKHDQVFSLYHEGMKAGIFRPQFHGREHVQANRWLHALRHADEKMSYAFDCDTTYSGSGDYNYMESFDWDTADEMEGQKEIVRGGLGLFRNAFGFSPMSFIAPCYTWDPRLEPTLAQGGIRYMQGSMNQYIPRGGLNNYERKKHILGEQQSGLTFLTRNCFFEPSLVSKSNWVDYTLASIRDAFRWNKPAIICAHRINFIGFIEESNRTLNLEMLDELLRRILIQWPDVEFLGSDKLGSLIAYHEIRR